MVAIEGNFVDAVCCEIFPARIKFDTHIRSIERIDNAPDVYILPGFVDAHVHVESSMLPPSEFARIALRHGTLGAVADPHEIANVAGIEGISYMIADAEEAQFRFLFGAPSCVPATQHDTAGKSITANDIDKLFAEGKTGYLSEMMNFPGVVNRLPEVMEKIAAAKKYGKNIDGHAPGLRGEALIKYVNAGITTDHECITLEEAEEKIKAGMKILIREGSAAKNFDVLSPLIEKYPDKTMLCTDDLHPDDLLRGHINLLLAKGVAKGLNLFSLLRSATITPVEHYQLDLGLVQTGDYADFIVIDSLEKFNVEKCFLRGNCVFDKNTEKLTELHKLRRTDKPKDKRVNNFNASKISAKDIEIIAATEEMKVIQAIDGELFTKQIHYKVDKGATIVPDINNDILKIILVNRYKHEKPAVAFVNGFGLKRGAIVSSVAHDSHHIIAVGCDDCSLVQAINHIIDIKGGLAIIYNETLIDLSLDIAGLMSSASGEEVAKKYEKLNNAALRNSSVLTAPFMTLAFMALLVIPELKIGTKGLFDVNRFEWTSAFSR